MFLPCHASSLLLNPVKQNLQEACTRDRRSECGLKPGGPWLPGHPPVWSAGPWGQGRGRRRLQMETMTSGSWNVAWGTSMLICQWEAP